MTQVDELVRQARSALETGNRLAARGYWRRATRVAPDRLDLWQSLLQVTEAAADRQRCLENILRLDPDNDEARAELERMVPSPSPLTLRSDSGQASGGPGRGERQALTPTDRLRTAPSPSPLTLRSDSGQASGGTEGGPGRGEENQADELRLRWEQALAAGEPLFCVNHPQRETTLRCNRCGAPICVKCARRTPVGFRCPACIREQQAAFYNAQWYDYPLAAVVSFALSIPAAIVAGLAGWWFSLLISPLIGGMIGGLVHRIVGRRRGKWIWLAVGAGVALGALVAFVAVPGVGSRSILSIGIYGLAATGAAVGVLRLGKSR